jgi:hypothetical protein
MSFDYESVYQLNVAHTFSLYIIQRGTISKNFKYWDYELQIFPRDGKACMERQAWIENLYVTVIMVARDRSGQLSDQLSDQLSLVAPEPSPVKALLMAFLLCARLSLGCLTTESQEEQ